MSAVIQFRPIVGAGEETGMCYLLQINDYCILLDCGWDESFDPSLLSTLKVFFFFFLDLFFFWQRKLKKVSFSKNTNGSF